MTQNQLTDYNGEGSTSRSIILRPVLDVANHFVQIKLQNADGKTPGIVTRYEDDNNFTIVYTTSSLGNYFIEFLERVGGSNTNGTPVNTGISTSDPIVLRVEIFGNKYRAFYTAVATNPLITDFTQAFERNTISSSARRVGLANNV